MGGGIKTSYFYMVHCMTSCFYVVHVKDLLIHFILLSFLCISLGAKVQHHLMLCKPLYPFLSSSDKLKILDGELFYIGVPMHLPLAVLPKGEVILH